MLPMDNMSFKMREGAGKGQKTEGQQHKLLNKGKKTQNGAPQCHLPAYLIDKRSTSGWRVGEFDIHVVSAHGEGKT